MLLNLKLDNKTVLIIGGGKVSEEKAKKFLEAGSKVIVVSKSFTSGLESLREKVKLLESEVTPTIDQFIPESDLIIAATDDRKLNRMIVEESKKKKILACAVDDQSIGDFSVPAILRKGSIEIAISTGGKSPAMAKILREKVDKIITEEDILHVELQDYARKIAKAKIQDLESRKEILYQIIHDRDIRSLLLAGKLNEAKIIAEQIIEEKSIENR